MTTIEAVAELIMMKLNPQTGDEPLYELEDLIESAKNSYMEYIWNMYMAVLGSDGERTIMEGLTHSHAYPWAGESQLDISDINIIALPRDAGLHSAVLVDKDNRPFGGPLVKTNAASLHKTRRVNTGIRMYRDATTLYLPDDIPECVGALHITFAGTFEKTLTPINREVAAKIETMLTEKYLPGRNIPVDVNKNLTPE